MDSPAAPPAPLTASRLAEHHTSVILGYWPLWLCLLLSLLLGIGLQQQDAESRLIDERHQAEQRLAALRDRLEATAQTTFAPTLGLLTMIQVDGDISDKRFELLLQRTMPLVPQLRAVSAAPDDVIRHIYPRAGNEAALGLDFRSIAAQWEQVEAARRLRQALIRAPLPLVQGGRGVIQRNPVFLRGPDGKERYWGVVSVVADLERFVAAAGLPFDADLELALHNTSNEGGPGTLIWGSAALAGAAGDDGEPVMQTAHLPGADWLLLARPRGGWESQSLLSPRMTTLWSGLAVLNLLLALLTHMWRKQQRDNKILSQEIEQGRLTREQLEASQARFRTLAVLASDWVWEQDAELRFTYISRVAEEATNTSSALVLGFRRWESPALLPGTDWEAHKHCMERRETFRDFEYGQVAADGKPRYLSVSGAPCFDADGQFCGYRGTGRDITAQRRAEVEIQAARDRLQAVLDAAVEVAIIATDAQDRITVFNRGAERMLGYQAEAVMGQSPKLWHLPEEIEARAEALTQSLGRPVEASEAFAARALLEGSDTQVWTMVRRDGSRLEASLTVSVVYSRQGELIGFLGVARDISAQRQAERELRALNTDLEARVAARAAELTQTLATLQHAQGELLRAERMAALGSLVAGVAHELNTPLGNCLTTASTLEGRSREIAAQLSSGSMRRSTLETYLEDTAVANGILLRGLNSACSLVQHFKQLSVDQTSEQRRSFALHEVVGDVLGLAQARWKTTPYRLVTELKPLPRELDSYPGPLGQVLSNLLQNALMHAFEGRSAGSLRIAARPLDDQSVELLIEDDGIGMSEEVRRRAFDPFFTTKLGRGGTGLGLNIVYNIITDVLGGRLDLLERPGGGTLFLIHLPYVAPGLQAAAGESPLPRL